MAKSRPPAPPAPRIPWLPIVLAAVVAGAAFVLFQVLPQETAFEAAAAAAAEREAAQAAVPALGGLQAAAPGGAAPSQVDPLHHPAMRRVEYLRSAVRSYNLDALLLQLDLAAWYQATVDPSQPMWTAVSRGGRDRFAAGLAARLADDRGVRELAEHEPTAALAEQEAAGRLVLTLRSASLPERRWRVTFSRSGGEWFIAALESAREEPPAAAAATPQAEEKKATDELFVTLDEGDEGEEIADSDGRARIFRGAIQKVPLLPETTPDDARRMEDLVQGALAGEGKARPLAERELVRLGRPVVPLLLNRLADLPLTDDPARLEAVVAVDALLQKVTRRYSGFPLPGRTNIEDPAKLAERRRLTLESWFGWWERYKNRWDSWEQEAGIPPPEPERGPRP